MINKSVFDAAITIEAIPATAPSTSEKGCIGCCFYNHVTAECSQPAKFPETHNLPKCRNGYVYIVTDIGKID